MRKRVLDVGNCSPDFSSVRSYLTRNFDCEVVQAHDINDAMSKLREGQFDLVLVNRKLDIDYSDGIEVIRKLKADPDTASVPMMLVTNYQEHQDAAVAAGAIRGFGKLQFEKPETRDRLAEVLG